MGERWIRVTKGGVKRMMGDCSELDGRTATTGVEVYTV